MTHKKRDTAPAESPAVATQREVERLIGHYSSLQYKEEELRKQRSFTWTYVGAAMRDMRKAKGLSLREAARQLKCSAPFLSDMENGRRGQSIEWIRKLGAL